MSREGAILWIPTGTIPAKRLKSDLPGRRVILGDPDRPWVDISGWPHVTWHQESDDGRAAVHLQGTVAAVTVLPDCLLPHSVFSMWESTASVRGTVAWQGESTAVEGYMFFDHPRVLSVPNDVTPRMTYLYTTMSLGDGGCMYGYHAADEHGLPIEYYCFGVYVDRDGNGRFLARAHTDDLGFDKDGLPSSWRLHWADDLVRVDASISVRQTGILAGWGAPAAPRNRRQFSIIPLVLDGTVHITSRGQEPRTLSGRGLGEYFDARLWDA